MTLAATLATAPLAAHHFGTVSLTAIPANLVALPAIAPAMWLGMLSGALGQIADAPVEPLTWLGGLCASFIGWVARAFGPEWAQLDVPEPGPVAALVVDRRAGRRRHGSHAWRIERSESDARRPAAPRRLVLALACTLAACAAAVALVGSERPEHRAPAGADHPDPRRGPGRRHPRRAPDPPAATRRQRARPTPRRDERLADLGIEELSAIAITHDELDHSGGLAERSR